MIESNLLTEINSLYSANQMCCDGYHELAFNPILRLKSILDRIAKEIFQRKKKADDLDTELIQKEWTILSDAVEDIGTEYTPLQLDKKTALKTNLLTFVATKNYKQQFEMIQNLLDENGNIRSFSSYKKQVALLGEKFNKNWLRAEYNTTKAAARAASQWNDFVRDQNVMPFLVYKTQNDSKVRPKHKELHDVIKPINDPFWDTYFPPNDWNCRCYQLQKRSTEGYITEPVNLPEIHPAFKHNAGKTQNIWTTDHPYFQDVPDEVVKKIEATKLKIMELQ